VEDTLKISSKILEHGLILIPHPGWTNMVQVQSGIPCVGSLPCRPVWVWLEEEEEEGQNKRRRKMIWWQ
ncbi:unnamed protein product, partial [Musa hybrid cultivar]